MRVPRSLRDSALLEDEPFATHFLTRSVGKDRSRSSGINVSTWVTNIVEELKRDDDGLCAVRTWLGFAFSASPDDEPAVQKRSKAVTANDAFIRIFVRFYWELYEHPGIVPDEDSSAMMLLSKERKALGYWYSPDEFNIGDDGPAPAAELQTSQLHAKKRRQKTRRSLRRPSPSCDDDAYDAEVSDGEDDTMSRVSVANATDGVQLRIDGPGAVRTEQVDTQVAAEHIATADPKTDGGEVTPVTVLGCKRKAENDVPISPTKPTFSNDDPHSTAPKHIPDSIVDEDGFMSPLSELTGSESDAPHPMDVTTPDNTPASGTTYNLNGRPTRSASQKQRLTAYVEDMNAYEEEHSKGISGSDYETQMFPLGTARFPPRQVARRGTPLPQMAYRSSPFPKKKARHIKKPSESGTPIGTPSTLGEATPGPSSGVLLYIPSDPASIPSPAPFTAKPAKNKKLTTKKPRLRTAKKPRMRLGFGGDLPSRPSKRSRAEDALGVGAVDAQVGSIDGSSIEQPKQPNAADPRGQEGVVEKPAPPTCPSQDGQSVGPSAVSGDHVLTTSTFEDMAHSALLPVLKRKRAMMENTITNAAVNEAADKPDPLRLTIPLPRGRKARSTKDPMPIPPTLPRQPSCLADVDAVLQGAASSACLEATQALDPLPALPDWAAANDGLRQDDPPDSSDDETPLSVTVAAKTSGGVTCVPTAEDVATQTSEPILSQNGLQPQVPNRDPSPVPTPPLLAEPYIPPVSPAPMHPKPRLHVTPPIWAESRQEVCETFEWFRSYQGGVYFLKDMVKGYLLGGFAASRDLFARDGRVIISHGGGKAESIHTQRGVPKAHEAADQLEGDKSVRALLNTYEMRRPLALLVDDKYSLFPFDLATNGYTYVVLGFYRIAHAWAEEQPAQTASGSVVRYKFAFQWCEEQGAPWWLTPKSVPHGPCTEPGATTMGGIANPTIGRHPARDISSLLNACEPQGECPLGRGAEFIVEPKVSVPQCSDDSPVVLPCHVCKKQSPMVYAEGWMCLYRKCTMFWRSTQGRAPTQLTYAKSFLEPMPFAPEELGDLRPGLPAKEVEDGITTTSMFCKGWHCLRCGRLSSRYRWEHWHCKNCGQEYRVDGRMRDPKEFWTQPGPQHFTNHIVAHDSGIMALPMRVCELEDKRWGQVHTYILPDGRGSIHLISPPTTLRASATKAFMDYQTQADRGELLFRRWPLRAHKCRGTLLTNYFSQNCGEPYQYVGGTDNTVPWDRAPSAVCDALGLITHRMKRALGIDANFNEVLSAAYMERQKMAFHSDAERGLGPIVASLSLGSGAYMYFRLLGKHTDKKGQGSDRNALTLYLRHGDVVVMQGADVQNYYEHTVVPVNFRIAATARTIDSRNH